MRLVNLALILCCLWLIGQSWFYSNKTTVVSFDRQKIHGQFIRQLAEHQATKIQVARATVQFKTVLQKTLKDYSNSHQVTILDHQLLLAGGKDVTDVIGLELAKAMRGSS